MQKGIENEKNFAEFLDNKRICDLPIEFQYLIFAIFKNIDSNIRIECWKSNFYEKADIKIKINNEIKGISIKTGHYCSMHQEKTDLFYKFLTKIGVEKKIIEKFEEFMLGYIKGKKVSSVIYIEKYPKDIKLIRDSFNEYYIKTNLILRFLFQGTENQKYDCDAIIHGTPSHFLWATKNEILKYLIEYNTPETTHLNFSALHIKNYDRNLIERKGKEKEIQVKWDSIEKDLKSIKNKRNLAEIEIK